MDETYFDRDIFIQIFELSFKKFIVFMKSLKRSSYNISYSVTQ